MYRSAHGREWWPREGRAIDGWCGVDVYDKSMSERYDSHGLKIRELVPMPDRELRKNNGRLGCHCGEIPCQSTNLKAMVFRSIFVRGESIQIKKWSVGGSKPPSVLCEIWGFYYMAVISNRCKRFFFSTNLKVMVYRSILVRGESIQIKNKAWGLKSPRPMRNMLTVVTFDWMVRSEHNVVYINSESWVASDINMHIAHKSVYCI